VSDVGWLTGWKTIANHFDVGWKVAKRWHKLYKMPILRTPEGRPTNTPQELDLWFIEFNRIMKNKKS